MVAATNFLGTSEQDRLIFAEFTTTALGSLHPSRRACRIRADQPHAHPNPAVNVQAFNVQSDNLLDGNAAHAYTSIDSLGGWVFKLF
jgi:hypothetical protein